VPSGASAATSPPPPLAYSVGAANAVGVADPASTDGASSVASSVGNLLAVSANQGGGAFALQGAPASGGGGGASWPLGAAWRVAMMVETASDVGEKGVSRRYPFFGACMRCAYL